MAQKKSDILESLISKLEKNRLIFHVFWTS